MKSKLSCRLLHVDIATGIVRVQHADRPGIHTPLPFIMRHTYIPGTLVLSGIVTDARIRDEAKYRVVPLRNGHLSGSPTGTGNLLQYPAIPLAHGLDILVSSKKRIWPSGGFIQPAGRLPVQGVNMAEHRYPISDKLPAAGPPTICKG